MIYAGYSKSEEKNAEEVLTQVGLSDRMDHRINHQVDKDSVGSSYCKQTVNHTSR
jgi:predicted ABC-type transport system involved in lysophospholipase L1 biosynthesis ATPase subunit